MMDFGWLPEAGAAGLILIVTILFLRFLSGERKDRTKEGVRFLDVITNHIKHSDETLQKLTGVIEKLMIIIDERL